MVATTAVLSHFFFIINQKTGLALAYTAPLKLLDAWISTHIYTLISNAKLVTEAIVGLSLKACLRLNQRVSVCKSSLAY